jgi:hypothetical protein
MEQPQASAGGWGGKAFAAACAVNMLTFVMHTAARFAGAEPPQEPDQKRLVELMSSVQVHLPGATRSTQELLDGFGWHFGLSHLAMGVIGLAVGRTAGRRAYAGAAAVVMAVLTVNSQIHFFAVPTACMALAAVLYGAAFFLTRRS